jgi:hypothetical protein
MSCLGACRGRKNSFGLCNLCGVSIGGDLSPGCTPQKSSKVSIEASWPTVRCEKLMTLEAMFAVVTGNGRCESIE